MPVTIISAPYTHTPGYNPQNFVVSSNNTAQPNFKYVSEIFIDLISDPIKRKFPKRPDNSWAYIECEEITRDYLRNEFIKDQTDFYFSQPGGEQKSAIKRVDHIISEEYGSPVSGFPGTTGTYYIWNSAYQSIEYANYVYATTTVSKDLTLSPDLTDKIHFDQRNLMKTWHRGFGTRENRYLLVEAYDSSGNSIQATVLENIFYDTAPLYRRAYLILNCSPYGLNNNPSVVSKSDSLLDVIPSNTVRYTYYFIDSALANSSNINTVYVKPFCSKYERYVLLFLNRLGNYDSFTFNRVNKKPTDKESQSYKKLPFALNTSNKYTYSEDVSDTVVYSTTLTNKHIINTDWLTEDEALWLKDLIMSPEIKIENEDNSIYSVKCTMKSYEPKQKVNDKLIQITIELEYDLQDKRQRS